jgi:hypothetical protein
MSEPTLEQSADSAEIPEHLRDYQTHLNTLTELQQQGKLYNVSKPFDQPDDPRLRLGHEFNYSPTDDNYDYHSFAKLLAPNNPGELTTLIERHGDNAAFHELVALLQAKNTNLEVIESLTSYRLSEDKGKSGNENTPKPTLRDRLRKYLRRN